MFARKPNAPWDNWEETTLFEISKRPDSLMEIAILEKFRKTNPTFPDFPSSVPRLLENWNATLDRANKPVPHTSCITGGSDQSNKGGHF